MQDIFIALIFVAMVIYPALSATLTDRQPDGEESLGNLTPALAPATETRVAGKAR